MDKIDALKRVRAALEQSPTGTFCFVCGRPDPEDIRTGTGQLFRCSAGHESPRAYIFDGKAVHDFASDRLIHETAGALVQRPSGDEQLTLLFLRRKFPFLYTIPAGHLEINQDPAFEMARELDEEAGLVVESAEPLWPVHPPLLYDPCRRGADWHRWRLYRVSALGTPRLSDEGRIIGWYRESEVQALAAQKLLTAPVYALFERLGMVPRATSKLTESE